MRFSRPFAAASVVLAFACLSFTLAARAETPAPENPAPKGEVDHYRFTESRIFPGTVRDYWIYIPQQYNPATPACLFVDQDGIQFDAPAVFDRLIASHEMPVTIGVFVTPGVVPAASPDALPRFNRSLEYDGLGPDYVNFLLNELLPAVEQKTAKDGRPIHLSHNGNDRCIAGASSGAICAFTAAWERPDSFSRVFSAIGTFVGLRGGNVYPTLIRETEPKPLRVFLQDGSADQNIYGGDWWMANQEMERALRFAGYEVNHVWGTGGHSGQQGTEIFPDVMRWIWTGWPAPIKTGAGSAPLQEIVTAGEPWEMVTDWPSRTQVSGIRGRYAVVRHDGSRYATEPGAKIDSPGRVWLITPRGKKRVVDTGLKDPTGITLSPDQSLLYVAEGGSHWVYSYQIQPDGSLADRQRYYHLHAPDTADNSGAGGMCVDRDGRLYVATAMGIQECDQAGRVNVIMPVPGGTATDVTFGGVGSSDLYAAAGGQIYRRHTKVTGAHGSDEPNKPAPPRL